MEVSSKSLSGPLKSAAISALSALKGYAEYLDETNKRVSTFKSFADPARPVSLLDHFVTMYFDPSGTNEVRIDQDEMLDVLHRASRVVISATAGFGKSMAMRFFALSMYQNPRGKIPLFVELRHLNRVTAPKILTYINSSYGQSSRISLKNLQDGLSSGAFCLILDGFDELNHEIRKSIEDQILEISNNYPRMTIVVSGRPDERFNSWRDFQTFKVCPMGKPEVIQLLEKLDYDSGVKKRFIKKVRDEFYESHTSFLSTPLLAILMLITFERNANIPEKLHLFYSKAFETLFEKHDATKEQHERARKTTLAIDQFKALFATFCLHTYVQEQIEFDHAGIIKSLRDSIKYQSMEVNPEDFLFDIEESVCLMMREGGSFFFIHRSFQEYFTAVFLSICPAETRDEFLNSSVVRSWDSVLPMLFDMGRAQIEPTWVKRNLGQYVDEVGTRGKKVRPLQARFEGVLFHRVNSEVHYVDILPGKFSRLIFTLRRFYPEFGGHSVFRAEVLEEFARGNWDTLKDESDSRTRRTKGAVELKKVGFDQIPLAVLRGSGLTRIVQHEHTCALERFDAITETQLAQSQIISKLFG
ncbi:MAG: NACHT domain-containing protein [Sphingomicrobium sp.]